MTRHRPTCRCVECEATAILRLTYAETPHAQRAIGRLRREYRKAMRLLAVITDGLKLGGEAEQMVAKWREGK